MLVVRQTLFFMNKIIIIFWVAFMAGALLFSAVGANAQETLTASISAASEANVNDQISFQVNVSGGSGAYSYVWDFDDGEQTAGQAVTHAYSSSGSKTVTVTVTDTDSRQASANVSLTIQTPDNPSAPTVDLKVNNQDGSISVAANATVTLSWSTTNASTCVASGAWSGERSTGSSETTAPLAAGSTNVFTLTCTGVGGSASDSVTVNVQNDGGNNSQPSVDLKVNGSATVTVAPGSAITLSWTGANVTTCVASGSIAWHGARATSGSESLTASATPSTSEILTLTCASVAAGQVSDSVTITTTSGTSDPLTISNIRVTDVTKTSAIIRWTTNRAASSRVIYDTVSHSSISGQSAPNYGYQFSTETGDTGSGKVTEHAVTITNLTANTQYFFRVISED